MSPVLSVSSYFNVLIVGRTFKWCKGNDLGFVSSLTCNCSGISDFY